MSHSIQFFFSKEHFPIKEENFRACQTPPVSRGHVPATPGPGQSDTLRFSSQLSLFVEQADTRY